MNVADDSTSVKYLRVSQIWVAGILLEQCLTYLFGWATKRGYEMDNWRWLDVIMFGTMVALMLGLHEDLVGPGKTFEGGDPVLFNAALHSIMMILIWLRFLSVLITSKKFGPFIRMIYLMIKQVVNFLVLFFCLMVCFAAVFTSLFNESSADYETFTKSVRTLYSSAIGVFDFTAFTENEALGGILLGAYLLAAHVLLLNLLIALLSNIYSEVITRVDAEHRAVVVAYYDRWFWDDSYGVLIFAPSPLTYLVLLISPFVLFSKHPQQFNTFLVKSFYIFYAIPQYLLFLLFSLFMVPLMYFKGFSHYGKSVQKRLFQLSSPKLKKQDSSFSVYYEFSALRALAWTLIGVPILLWAVLRDSYDFLTSLYLEHDLAEESEKTKAQGLVNHKMLTNLEDVLEGVVSEEIPLEQFVEVWLELETAAENLNPHEIHEKRQLAMDFFIQFATSTKLPKVNVEIIRRLLPKQEFYNEEYIERVQNIHIPWLMKGLKQYQEKVGALVIGGVSIPKELGLYGGPLDIQHLESMEVSVQELGKKYSEISRAVLTMKGQLDEQKSLVKFLTTSGP